MQKIKSNITNGCGGKGSSFKPPYHIFFETSCTKHDEYYNKGGDSIDRYVADIYLLEYMKRDARRKNMILMIYFYIWSYLYYFAVRIAGGKYYNRSNDSDINSKKIKRLKKKSGLLLKKLKDVLKNKKEV